MDDMRVTSVNVGREETIDHGNRRFTTGIRKRPVDGAVYIGADSVAGDTISDKKHHGGADQVVYAYSADDYEWWSAQLGRELAPGTFGENLTIEGLPTDLNVGDRLLIGEVLLEATAPRIENPAPVVSILALYRLAYDLSPDPDALERYLEAPLAERLRASIEEKLSAARRL